MRKGKNGQADLDKGFKTGYFSFFNHQACVFYLCDMNYRAVQEKRKHLKYQGFLPWNKGRSIGQSKKTVQYSYPCPYGCGGWIWTTDLRVMSCYRQFNPLISSAFRPFSFQKTAKSRRSYAACSAGIFPVLGQVMGQSSNTLSEIRHYKTKHPNGGARSKEQWLAGHKLHSKRLIHWSTLQ